MDLSHLKQKFVSEAENLLTSLDNTLIELEKDKGNKTLIGEAFRVMHTIKGASGMYGFDKIVEITHELESLFDLVREAKNEAGSALIEISFNAADHIRTLLVDEKLLTEKIIHQHSVLLNNIEVYKTTSELIHVDQQEIKKTTVKTDNSLKTWHILFYPNDEIIERAINLVYTFHDLFILGDYKIYKHPFHDIKDQYWSIFLVTDKGYDEMEEALMFIMDYCKIFQIADYDLFNTRGLKARIAQKEVIPIHEPPHEIHPVKELQYASVSESQNNTNPKRETGSSFSPVKHKTSHINVDASKLDSLMYLVSELVTTKSELLISLTKENIAKAMNAGDKIEKLSKLFSENALNLRLVSIHEMTEKFKRLIRDLAKQLGKQINFCTIGSDTELDKSIIDHIGEPVMHLIRNCIDHGIEMPEARKRKGKPDTGNITFETVKSGNYVYIIISDDGNGIDKEYILKKAKEKGFIQSDVQLSEKEIYDLIFLPGFSTAESLSNVSGRGVGMDIVLKKISEIRGEISISSNLGIGTTFTMKLQQTVSIIDTLLVNSNGATYAIPLGDIHSCILEAHENLIDRQNQLLHYQNELIPFIYIETLSQSSSSDEGLTDKLVVIKKHDQTFALVVDNIIGEYQAVIKPLGQAFSKVQFLSGASLLGDGSIALLIDTDKLWYQPSEISIHI